jgi:hypothetical protein
MRGLRPKPLMCFHGYGYGYGAGALVQSAPALRG